MAELKTKENDGSVDAYLDAVEPAQKREDSFVIREMMEEATGASAKMWGDSIVGFGRYHYLYESGREGDWFVTGFAPRKRNLTLYIMSGFDEYDEILSRLGKYKTGVSCLYINKLADVDNDLLRELIERSVVHMRESNG